MDLCLKTVLLVQFCLFDLVEIAEEYSKQMSCVIRQRIVLHLEEGVEQEVHVGLAQFDHTERCANLLQQFFADRRFLNRQNMLNAAKDANVDGRLSLENRVQLLFNRDAFLLLLVLFLGGRELFDNKLLMNQLDLFQED